MPSASVTRASLNCRMGSLLRLGGAAAERLSLEPLGSPRAPPPPGCRRLRLRGASGTPHPQPAPSVRAGARGLQCTRLSSSKPRASTKQRWSTTRGGLGPPAGPASPSRSDLTGAHGASPHRLTAATAPREDYVQRGAASVPARSALLRAQRASCLARLAPMDSTHRETCNAAESWVRVHVPHQPGAL